MQIKINVQHIHLSPHQEEMIHSKIEHLSHLSARLDDESSEVRVDLIYEKSRSAEDAYKCHLTFFVPQDTLRTESHSDSIENAFDDAIDKMKTQIEYYKSKIHHMEKRKGAPEIAD